MTMCGESRIAVYFFCKKTKQNKTKEKKNNKILFQTKDDVFVRRDGTARKRFEPRGTNMTI